MSEPDLQPLRSILAAIKPGKLSEEDVARVLPELAAVWDKVPGAIDTDMAARKLGPISNKAGSEYRARTWVWEPPVLSFSIVRHGGAALGSKRGERQRWSVHLDEARASWVPDGFEQLVPNEPAGNSRER
jgi:hypothetical protein